MQVTLLGIRRQRWFQATWGSQVLKGPIVRLETSGNHIRVDHIGALRPHSMRIRCQAAWGLLEPASVDKRLTVASRLYGNSA